MIDNSNNIDPDDSATGRAVRDDPVHLELLTRRLAQTADDEGILDVAYRTLDTPVGELLIAATPTGIVRVAYPVEDHDAVLQQLADTISPRLLRAPARLDEAAAEMDEYFTGRRQAFDLRLDWRLASDFRQLVLNHLRREVGFGRTASYAAIAAGIGHPTATRAVGGACATNPLPVIVPCHRVVRSNGAIGDYIGGVHAKQTLLDLEHRYGPTAGELS